MHVIILVGSLISARVHHYVARAPAAAYIYDESRTCTTRVLRRIENAIESFQIAIEYRIVQMAIESFELQ